MTQNGSPYENAIAERVNGILKSELGLDKIFVSYHEAIGQTQLAINSFFSTRQIPTKKGRDKTTP